MGTEYEHELRRVLAGDMDMIDQVTRSCDLLTTDKYRKVASKPFLVVRAAGSGPFDLVALREDISFPIEVKSSKNDRLYLSTGRLADQLESLTSTCTRSGLVLLYAYRLKRVHGDSWRVFTPPTEDLSGRLAILHRRIPKLRQTPKGNHVMDWGHGMPLHAFIDYLCTDVEDI